MSSPNSNVGGTFDRVIWTSFYRTIPDVTVSGCVEEPHFNYRSYDLFVLTTRITHWLGKNWDPVLTIRYPSVEKNNRFYVTIVPIDGNNPIVMTKDQVQQLQKYVDLLTSQPLRGVLIISSEGLVADDSADGVQKVIPSCWVRSILPFVGISPSVNPHLSGDGIIVELGDVVDYMNVYHKLMLNILKRIRSMYKEGFIVNPSPDIIDKWGLEPYNDFSSSDSNSTRLYKPNWNDTRITSKYGGMYGFLMSRMSGDTSIELSVGNKLLVKHNLSKYMLGHDVVGSFSDQQVRISTDSIREAQMIASHVDLIKSEGYGTAFEMIVSRPSWIKLYMAIAEKMGYDDTSTYLSSVPDQSYVFSCVVPPETNISEVVRIINVTAIEMVSRIENELDVNIEVSMTRQGFKTVHDLIENGDDIRWRRLLN